MSPHLFATENTMDAVCLQSVDAACGKEQGALIDHDAPPQLGFVKTPIRLVCNRWMQRAARSGFATSMVQECTTVLDCNSAGARREIDHDAPPQLGFCKN